MSSSRDWALVDRGLWMLHEGEKYWLDIHVGEDGLGRVSIDLQHHGMMGQPGAVERVGEGVWREGIVDRSGTLPAAAFEAAEAVLRENLSRARSEN